MTGKTRREKLLFQPRPRRVEFRAENKAAVGSPRFGHRRQAFNPVGNTGRIAIGQVISHAFSDLFVPIGLFSLPKTGLTGLLSQA